MMYSLYDVTMETVYSASFAINRFYPCKLQEAVPWVPAMCLLQAQFLWWFWLWASQREWLGDERSERDAKTEASKGFALPLPPVSFYLYLSESTSDLTLPDCCPGRQTLLLLVVTTAASFTMLDTWTFGTQMNKPGDHDGLPNLWEATYVITFLQSKTCTLYFYSSSKMLIIKVLYMLLGKMNE